MGFLLTTATKERYLMGLDNIPANYPCRTDGTAVWTDDPDSPRIDCEATIDAGGCPWHNAEPPEAGRVLGIFAAPCWYRGKYGNALIDEYATYDESTGASFYGSNDSADFKTPDECRDLADVLDATIKVVDNDGTGWTEDGDRDGMIYAAWWLRFAADKCGGTIAWF